MIDGIERTLVSSLEQQAARPVDTTGLATAAARRGRTLRRRRWVSASAGVAAVVVAGAFGVTTLRPAPSVGQSVGGTVPTQTSTIEPGNHGPTPPLGGWRVPALPLASGVPGAAVDPTLVGAEPGILHFSLDGLLTGARSVTWSAGFGHESIRVEAGGKLFGVDLTRDVRQLDTLLNWLASESTLSSPLATSNTTVGRQPAIYYTYRQGQPQVSYLRWQPLPGVWAQVQGQSTSRGDVVLKVPEVLGVADAIGVATKLRVYTAYQCITPIRLSALPPNAQLLNCEVSLSGENVPDSEGMPTRLVRTVLTVGRGDDQAEIIVEPRKVLVAAPDVSLAGHPAQRIKNGRNEWGFVVSDFDGVRIELFSRGGYGYPELTTIGNGIKVDGDLRNPSSWSSMSPMRPSGKPCCGRTR